jgi:4-aminobutyrate aminotransferase / (S)-3-amino-2-methylpropionate transaminase / 5-aminovalerate transaminase
MAAKVVTAVPGPRSLELRALVDEYVPQAVFNTHPIFAESGEGSVLVDVDGNHFLDFTGGLGVLNVGHLPPTVVSAVQAQLGRFTHTCFHVAMYEGYPRLAQALARVTPGDHAKKTVLVNSGAEAVENAVKIARHATGRPGVIVFDHAFHGRTQLGMTMTAKPMPYKAGLGPAAPEIYRMPFPYSYRCPSGHDAVACGNETADYIEDAIHTQIGDDRIAALVIEPVQGEGGFHVAPPGFLTRLREICDYYGIVFVADEIQSGFGRTSTFFACEHDDVVPDIVISAKSLGAGFPIAAVTGRAELMDSVHVGGLGGTYGGNPVSIAAALAVIDMLTTAVLDQAAEMGDQLAAYLDRIAEENYLVGEHRGLGAMRALELVTDRDNKTPAVDQTRVVIRAAADRGLLLLGAGTYGNVIRILAPLTTPPDQLEEGLAILDDCMRMAASS